MTHALRIPSDHTKTHKMSVMIDMKRTSPTFPDQKTIVDFSSAGRFAELLTLAGANSFLINTDEVEYGGKYEELKECTTAVKKAYTGSGSPPACIRKDLIIHPIQVPSHIPVLCLLEQKINRTDAKRGSLFNPLLLDCSSTGERRAGSASYRRRGGRHSGGPARLLHHHGH